MIIQSKKLLTVLLVLAMFVACSSPEPTTPVPTKNKEELKLEEVEKWAIYHEWERAESLLKTIDESLVSPEDLESTRLFLSEMKESAKEADLFEDRIDSELYDVSIDLLDVGPSLVLQAERFKALCQECELYSKHSDETIRNNGEDCLSELRDWLERKEKELTPKELQLFSMGK